MDVVFKQSSDVVSHESTEGFVFVFRSETQIQICEQGSAKSILLAIMEHVVWEALYFFS